MYDIKTLYIKNHTFVTVCGINDEVAAPFSSGDFSSILISIDGRLSFSTALNSAWFCFGSCLQFLQVKICLMEL